jgi:hypothetical protein
MNESSKSILQMSRGAIIERVDLEMSKIIENIMDPNTKATEKRKLTLTLTLTPDDNRQTVSISTTAKPTLATTSPVVTALYIAGTDETGQVTAVEMTPNIPGQVDIYGGEQEPAATLKLIKCS